MEPVGLGVKVQQPFETIGNVMNIANTAQQMQRGNLALQTEDMVLRERKGVEQFLANPRNYMNERGEVDFPKLQSSVLSIAPTTGSQYIQHVTEAQKAGTEARRALNTASEEERKIAGTLAMSLTGKPAAQAAEILTGYATQNPNLKPAVDAMVKYYIAPNAGNQKGLDAAYLNIGRGIMTPSEQDTAISGRYTPTGGTLTQTGQVAQAAGMAQPSLPVTMAPGNLETIETDAYNRKHIVSRSPQGTILSTRPMPESGGAAGGQRRSQFNAPPGDPEAVPAFTAERTAINNAAKSAQNSIFNNDQIIRLADETHPGKGAEILQRLGGGYAALPWTSDSATNLNRLGHFIALETVQNAQQMGIGGTDAGRSLSAQATTDTQWTKDAIKSAAKVNKAISTGLLQYNAGMENAIKAAGDDVLAIRDFKNKWTQSFDIDLFRYANALEKKDAATIDEILGKPGSKERAERAKALAAKSARINQLVTTGQ
jgi:hypothetical protein